MRELYDIDVKMLQWCAEAARNLAAQTPDSDWFAWVPRYLDKLVDDIERSQ